MRSIKNDGIKRIIVQYGKHGNDYYDASTLEIANASFLKMFKNNQEMEFYSFIYDKSAALTTEVAQLEAQTKPLPEGLPSAHYELAEKTKALLVKKKKDLAIAQAETDLLTKAEAGDIDAIKKLLCNRKEYETFSIEELQ